MNSHNADTIVIDSMYLSLFEGIDMGMYVLDAENRLAYASPAFERVTGLGAGGYYIVLAAGSALSLAAATATR